MAANPDQLAAELSEIDTAAGIGADPQPEAPPEAPPELNNAAELAAVLRLVVGILAPLFPRLPAVYTESTTEALAAVTVPLANKHGWNLTGGKYAEEIAFLAVAGPLGAATWAACRADLADRREAERKARESQRRRNASAGLPGYAGDDKGE